MEKGNKKIRIFSSGDLIKKIFNKIGILLIIVFFSFSGEVHAEKAVPTPQKVMLNGEEVKIAGYLINNNNYFKIRDLAAILRDTDGFFNVTYNKKKEAVEILPNIAYAGDKNDLKPVSKGNKTAIKSLQKFYLKDKPINLSAYSVEGNNYFKLRDLGQALNFKVNYDKDKNTVVITAKKKETSSVSGLFEEIMLPAFPAEGIAVRKYLYKLSFNVRDAKNTTPNYDATENILVLLTESGENIRLGKLKAIFFQNESKEVEIDRNGIITLSELKKANANFEKSYTITVFLEDGVNQIPLFSLKH